MWKPSLQPRSFGPRILDNTSSLPLSCHRRVHSTASTCLSRHCAFFQSNVQVNKISVLAPYMSISRRGLLTSRMQLSSIILVTEAKNRFPLFWFFGEVGVQQLWKPSLLPRSFGPRILDNISCLSLSHHRQVHHGRHMCQHTICIVPNIVCNQAT